MQTEERKNTFKSGRRGYIHLIREALPGPFVTFDYKYLLATIKAKYPNLIVRRTTISQNLRSLEETREIKIFRLGCAGVPTLYKKCNKNESW